MGIKVEFTREELQTLVAAVAAIRVYAFTGVEVIGDEVAMDAQRKLDSVGEKLCDALNATDINLN